MRAYVALVLHAHLPWVRHPEHERSLEERWLFEALWECYLPLLDVLDRLERDRVRAPFTLSISPPLLEMLADALLRARFEDHLDRLERLAVRERARLSGDSRWEKLPAFYAERIASARRTYRAAGRDVTLALARHAAAGRIELVTTTATHAFLPGLVAAPGAVRAQIDIGLATLEHHTASRPLGMWLPECAWDPRFAPDLAAAGVGWTCVDAHALELASPRPPLGPHAPVLGPGGVAFFARDPSAARDVWSRASGYPGDPIYREFWRDIGLELPEDALDGETGPAGTRVMTGLKYHRITGPGPDKEPYDPELAAARASRDASRFVADRTASLERAAARARSWEAPIVVAAYDAELFGHFWFEGPAFVEAVLRRLDATARAGGPAATTLGGYLERHPDLTVAQPETSTWGEGGYARVWAGPEAAPLWRHVLHAHARIRDALVEPPCGGAADRALDQAIVELFLMAASDWAFMLREGTTAEYARARFDLHRSRIERLLRIARAGRPTAGDESWLCAVERHTPFLRWCRGDALRAPLRSRAGPKER